MSDTRIFVKTDKGTQEVEGRVHDLAVKPRQLLIMLNGRRTVADLQTIFPPDMIQPTLEGLLAGGFICLRQTEPPPSPSSAPALVSASASATPTPEGTGDLSSRKTQLTRRLREIFGSDADAFTAKIDRAANEAELALLGQEIDALLGKGTAQKLGFTPAPDKPPARGADLSSRKQVFSKLLYDIFGPDGESFALKVEAATSGMELVALGNKYVEAVAELRGRKKGEAFAASLREAGIIP